MKPSELFGVVLRTLAVLIVLYSLYDCFSGCVNFFENILSRAEDGDSGVASTLSYFVFGIPEFIFGVMLFFLADWIAKLAYRDSSSPSP